MKRGYPGGGSVRKTANVGPDYPERNYRNPFDAGLDYQYGDDTTKTIFSPSDTVSGLDIPMNGGYDELWTEGK